MRWPRKPGAPKTVMIGATTACLTSSRSCFGQGGFATDREDLTFRPVVRAIQACIPERWSGAARERHGAVGTAGRCRRISPYPTPAPSNDRLEFQQFSQPLLRTAEIRQREAIQHREKSLGGLPERLLQDASRLDGAGGSGAEAGRDRQVRLGYEAGRPQH